MAITFEQEKGFNGTILAIVAVLAIFGGGGYWGWTLLNREPEAVESVLPSKTANLDRNILRDSRIANLEMFTEISEISATSTLGRDNPFLEGFGNNIAIPNELMGVAGNDGTGSALKRIIDNTTKEK